MPTETRATITVQDATGLDLEMEVAGVGSRSYAFVIDWHIRLVLVLLWALLIYLAPGPASLSAFDATARMLLMVVPPALVYFLYHPILEVGWNGWTPGKHFAGIRVVGDDGRPVGAGAHLVRNIFRIIDSMPAFYALGLAIAMFHRRQLRIGDMAAGTVLVYEPRAQRAALSEAEAGVRSARLDPREHEFALDLLRRWKSLDRQRRLLLAERFLASIGEPMPDRPGRRQLDAAIVARLRELTGG